MATHKLSLLFGGLSHEHTALWPVATLTLACGVNGWGPVDAAIGQTAPDPEGVRET